MLEGDENGDKKVPCEKCVQRKLPSVITRLEPAELPCIDVEYRVIIPPKTPEFVKIDAEILPNEEKASAEPGTGTTKTGHADDRPGVLQDGDRDPAAKVEGSGSDPG
jgi:hypothetical protein